MQRRGFIILGGAAAAWSFAARAQQADGVRRIGALIATTATDLDGQNRLAALRQGMRELGWSDGQNAQIDVRWADSDDLTRRYATEIVRLKPDVIVANGTPASIALRLQTQTIPIVFVAVTDPVGQGLVQSLPRPGGNLTGFTNFEFEMGGKWLQLLKEIMPQLTHVTVLFHPRTAPYAGLFLGPIQSAARPHSIEALASSTENEGDIASNIDACARYPSSGLIVIPSVFMTVHREVIVRLAARFRVPALYPFRYYATSGGLMSYGVDVTETFRRAASYVNRILKGEKPGDLPVQQPNKFGLVINLKTARALGLTVPPTLLARADEVIE